MKNLLAVALLIVFSCSSSWAFDNTWRPKRLDPRAPQPLKTRPSYTPRTSTGSASSGDTNSRSTQPEPPAQGIYRVILTGFHVTHETWDDAMAADGCRDEIYAKAQVQVFDKEGNPKFQNDLGTPKVLGDKNGRFARDPSRLRAGRGGGCLGGSRGGFATGDSYPSSRPWVTSTSGYADRIPWKIWEGPLARGGDKVVIMPSLIEWDNPGGSEMLHDYVTFTKNSLQPIGKFVGALVPGSGIYFEGADIALGLVLKAEEAGMIGRAGDRPIGFTKDPSRSGRNFKYSPKVIALDYDLVEEFLSDQGHQFGGKGRGILEIPLEEDTYLRGNYTMYLKVEKVR